MIEQMRGFKFTLIPTKEQEIYFKKASGTARWAYNFTLDTKTKIYNETGLNADQSDIRKAITYLKNNEEKYIWINEVSNNIPKQAVKDCDRAFQNFFKKQSGYPKFKSKHKSKDSFYSERIQFKRIQDKLYLKIEKLNSLILLSKDAQKYTGIETTTVPFLNTRISFNGTTWELSFSIKLNFKPKELTDEILGIDLGVKDTAICSDKTIYKNINKTSTSLKKLNKQKKRLQRKVSKKYEKNKQGNKFIKTNNIRKEEKKLLKINNKITNIRKDYTHKISRDIVNKLPKAIVMENLNITGMMKNKHLSKAIQEQNWYRLTQQIKYKAESQGTVFIQAPRTFKSTQTCSNCNNIQKIKLSERRYACVSCGSILDRDFNSALNLANYGKNYLLSKVS